jgi:ribosomal protein S18 acetylase RimI-like enzyme
MNQTHDGVVRKAAATDLEAVLRLDDLAVAGSRREAFLRNAIDAGECWVAVHDGVVIGFVVLDRSFYDQFFVSLLIVDPKWRRRGVATRLMRHAEAICPAEKLFTSTNESNVPMQRLCEKLGYARSGWIENLDERDPEIVFFNRLEGKLGA